MPEFKNLKELEDYLKRNPTEVLKHAEEEYLQVMCPICNEVEKIQNLRNGKGKCLKTEREFDINLEIS